MDLLYQQEELQRQCQHLEARLKIEIESRQSAERKLASANKIIADMTVLSVKYQNDIADLKSDIDAKDGYTLDLRTRYKLLRASHENLLKESKVLDAEAKSYQGEEKETSAVSTLKKEGMLRLGLSRNVKELQDEINKLQEERGRKEPLWKVGCDVRLRFLEQSREFARYVKRENLDKEIQEFGNRAAHGGNGEADASLFMFEAVPAHKFEIFTDLFRNLYHNQPTMFNSGPSHLREAINHEVTIRTLRTLNSSLDRPLLERQRAMEHIGIIIEKCAKLKDEKLVAEDTDIVRRVALVREETARIVELDRQSPLKALSLKENWKHNSSY